MARKYDLFLSYNSRDQAAVRQIHEDLKRLGLHPWFDREALTPGRLWQAEADKGLKSCRAAAVFIGPSGIGPWENLEMRALLTRVAQEGLPLIPVPLPGAPDKLELPPFLAELTWVDLRGGITPDGIAELVRGIPATKRKPKPPSKPVSLGPPRLHNLPPALGDWLKGRDKELRALATSLEGGGQTAIVQRHKALYGLGGIGKTRLAVEYGRRFGSRYTAAFFVRADSPEGLRAGLATLARADLLDLPERKAQAEEDTVHAVVRWLKLNPGWLLILDNVDTKEAEVAVLVFLSSLTGGHVLITSRLREWPDRIQTQPLGTIPLEEARDFLLKRTEKGRRRAPDDTNRARDLAEKLDGLPLALEQAGAYIVHTRLSFSEYLDTWEHERERVLKWYDPAIMEYPDSVAVTWQRSFDRLQPTAAALLRLTAFLAPDPIPEELFESGKEIVGQATEMLCAEIGQEGGDQNSIPEALAELESYSLITRQEAFFTVHRVVQEVLQGRISWERQGDWSAATLQIVNDYSPPTPEDVRTWPVWNLLRPHATALLRRVEELEMAFPAVAVLSRQLAGLLWAKGLYAEAELLMRRALAIDEKSYGSASPEVAVDLNDLAWLLQEMNRHSEAEPLIRRALAMDEVTFGKDHPEVATRLSILALLLKDTNRPSEAEPLLRRALAIEEKAFGRDHPKVSIRLNNLAMLLKDKNLHSEAESLMRRALAIDEKTLPSDHPGLAICLHNLALLLRDTNRLSEAEPLMRRAVGIWIQSLGPDHPHTQIGQKHLARLLEDIASQSPPPPAPGGGDSV